MRPLPECAFDDMNGVDVLHRFEPDWSELDARNTLDAENETDGDSVWLECSGDLFDVGSVKSVGVRKAACGFDTLVFICPQCNEPHESVRLR